MPLLFLVLLVQGEIYTWTDKEGVEHYTDDPNTIPREARRRVTAGAELGRVETGGTPLPVAAQPIPIAPPVVIIQQAAPVVDREEKWRKLFRDARERIASLEDEIESDRKKTEEVNGMPVNARFTCQQYGPPPLYLGPVATTGVTATVGGTLAPGVTLSATGTSTSTLISPYPVVVSPCTFGFNPEYERVRERLEKNRRELVRAKEALQDLDRRASFEAVPQHWRR